jgi:hypothetical protein
MVHLPWYYHVITTRELPRYDVRRVFGVIQLYHGKELYHGISLLQMYHLKNHGTLDLDIYYHSNTIVAQPRWNWPHFLGWYICTLVNHGTTDYHGTNVPPQKPWYDLPWYYHHGITLVKRTLIFGVVHLYHGKSWYNWLSWYKCTTPIPMAHFNRIYFTIVIWWWQYLGMSWYNWLPWYKCTMVIPWHKWTTPKKHPTFYHGITTHPSTNRSERCQAAWEGSGVGNYLAAWEQHHSGTIFGHRLDSNPQPLD